MLHAAMDGYYRRQRDHGGKFAWLGAGGGFIQPVSSASYHHPVDVGIKRAAVVTIAGNEPTQKSNRYGSGINFANNNSSVNNSVIGLHWMNLSEVHPIAGDTYDEFTFAIVTGPTFFPPTTARVIMRVFDGANTPIWFDMATSTVRFITNNFGDTLTGTIIGNRSLEIVWVILQRQDGTKEIWQDGTLIATVVHAMSPNVASHNLYYASSHFGFRSINGWSGVLGGGVFQTRAWTESQIRQLSADPYGHHKPQRRLISFPICLNASLGVAPVLDADLGTSPVLDASLGSAPVLDADLGTSVVLDSDLGTSLVLDADLRVCDKGG